MLGVRISDGRTDRHVTKHVNGLRFRKVAAGGCADLQAVILLPASAFGDLSTGDKVYVYDARTGKTVWEGFAQTPGRQSGDGGESFELNARGIMTITRSRADRYIYRTTSYDGWGEDATGNTASASASVGTFPDGSGERAGQPAVFCQLQPGTPVGTGQGKAFMQATWFADGAQKLGGVLGYRDGGAASSDYKTQLGLMPFDSWLVNTDLATAAVTMTLTAGVDFAAGSDGLLFGLQHTGSATNVATDDIWTALGVDAVLGDRVDKYGNRYNLPTLDHVYAYEVIADQIGRSGLFDPERVTIHTPGVYDPSPIPLEELAYTEPTRVQQIIDDLLLWEPDYIWRVLPSSRGLYGFEWRPWGLGGGPRYEIGESDGYSEEGSDEELANRIAVSWTDNTGATRTTIVANDVPGLGRIVDVDPVTMPGTSTAAQALKLGQQLLGALAAPSRSGSVTLSGRIKDLHTGGWVAPHEVEPGYLVRVRHLGFDLRATEAAYDHDAGTVTLTLGEPVYTVEQRVAALQEGRSLRLTSRDGYSAPTARYDTATYSTLYTYA